MTEIPVVPRAEYRIRVYGWAERNRGRTQITARARDANGQWITVAHFRSESQEGFLTETTQGWTEMEASFVFADHADRVRIMLGNSLGHGPEPCLTPSFQTPFDGTRRRSPPPSP